VPLAAGDAGSPIPHPLAVAIGIHSRDFHARYRSPVISGKDFP
jgi:hypothetical protein